MRCKVPIKDKRHAGLTHGAHGWYTSEGNSSLGKKEQVGFVHDPWKGLETHREVEIDIWEGDCWVYTCE